MFLEIAQLMIKQGRESEFEAVLARIAPRLLEAKGCAHVELRRSVETPSRYYLLVQWATVEDHTQTFATSATAREIGSMLLPFFETLPTAEHARLIPS
jgi:heme-degrading monooxygenase HmoA